MEAVIVSVFKFMYSFVIITRDLVQLHYNTITINVTGDLFEKVTEHHSHVRLFVIMNLPK